MGFSDRQVRALARGVPAKAIRSRTISGKELTYIEGWYALSQANRIFGFDGWDRETVETKCLQGREARGSYTAIYSARVRITVHTDGRVVVRDGHGTGEAYGGSVGEVHDRALKAAETDATKRALATFGKAFGLALYNGKVARKRANGHDAHARANRSTSVLSADMAPAASPAEPLRLNGVSRIDKSALSLAEPHRVRDKEHLRYVAAQPCLLCSTTPSDAHHLRFAQPRAMGRKVGDQFTVPLCRAHHRQLHHSGNESAFWHEMGIDALEAAAELWTDSQSPTQAEPAPLVEDAHA
jgi:hypothetical protein